MHNRFRQSLILCGRGVDPDIELREILERIDLHQQKPDFWVSAKEVDGLLASRDTFSPTAFQRYPTSAYGIRSRDLARLVVGVVTWLIFLWSAL